MKIFDLDTLADGIPTLSGGFCAMVAEAAAVCLTQEGHQSDAELEIRGLTDESVELRWQPITEEAVATYADPEVATEYGALAIAFLTVNEFTQFTIIRRSMKGTGFDYWLSNDDQIPFKEDARLEISGIRSGDDRQLRARIREKSRQTDRSDGPLPAYIAVVEFSRPVSYLDEKTP